MFGKLSQLIERFREQLNYNEAKARGPVPPVRVLRNPPVPKVTAKVQPEKPASTVSDKPQSLTTTHVVTRGNNKNVYVEVKPGQDVEDALKAADELSIESNLETIEDGLDPYNSGVYSRKQVWHEKR